MIEPKKSFRDSTATAALLIALGAPTAFAQQATVTTDIGTGQSITTTADYVAGNTQQLLATPTATTTNNNVNIDLTISSLSDDTVTTVAPAEDNLISASATGNISTGAAVLAFAPSTAGDTAAVGTLQSVEANVVAASTGDTHSIVIENTDTGVRTFTGAALQDNNDITASATGNNATSSLTVASGLDVEESGAGTASVALNQATAGAPNTSASADLLVSSSQEIDSVEAGVPLNITSTVTNANTTTRIEEINGATVTTANSDQASSATGNTATNSIESLDTTASITGTAAIANQQSIIPLDGATIAATTQGSTISVDVGGASVGDVISSTVLLSDNSQTSTATGSASTQTLTLDASNIIGDGPVASISDTAVGGGVQLSAIGDTVIGNVQSVESSVEIAATTSGNVIRSNMTPGSEVLNSTLEVDGNRQTASATGVTTENTLSLTSGATMSATGAVGSAQSMDGAVLATTTSNAIQNQVIDEDVVNSSVLTTDNAIGATATGAEATNSLSTTTATNNLSLATNSGAVRNGIDAGTDQPLVTAGQVLTNDQSQSGSASVIALVEDNQVLTSIGDDADGSTVTTDGNLLSSSATANTADNTISLAFNALTGGIAGGGVVAGLANDQTLDAGMTVTARNVGLNGLPVLTDIGSDAGSGPNNQGASISTSANRVDAIARGNVTTGNDVIVDATNIVTATEADPSITLGTGALNAVGSFVAGSTQVSGADILASQRDIGGTTSNTIVTQFGDDIQDSSSVVSDENILVASATANTASNSVQLGDASTATIAASGVVANYQGTTADGAVSAEIGIEGQDAVAAFTSLNAAGTEGGTIATNGTDYTNNGPTITYTFNSPLTPQEQAALTSAGFQNITANTADFANGTTLTPSGLVALVFGTGPDTTQNTGDETLAFVGFSGAGQPGQLNGAGVIVRIDDSFGGTIDDSTVSVSGNTVVGEVSGNIASNAASATASTITGLSAAATSITVADGTVAPANADLAVANLQESASVLSSDVAATFGIIADGDGNIWGVDNSTQTVSDNLQQSFATANRATNGVTLTATNTDADTALDSAQISSASVATTSDLDVVANAGGTNSSLAMEGNANQSVANGNIVTNAISLDTTNATATGTDNAAVNLGTATATANNVLASSQLVTGPVSASATTDVFNQDATRPGGNQIITSNVSLSDNATIAQATANSSGTSNALTLGTVDTANMERTGILLNTQTVAATSVTASVDQDVAVTLTNTGDVPVQSSSISLDGNSTNALARSNVITNTLAVNGANIAAGDSTDAAYSETAGTLDAAYVLLSSQGNAASVTATTDQSRVELDLSNAGGNVIDTSTISLSGNSSSATALANTAVNNVAVGLNAANVDATAALGNQQSNSGAVQATGGSAVGVYADTLGGTDPIGINGSSVLLSGNMSVSNAVGNQGQNTLTAAGTSITSGGTATSASLNAAVPNAIAASAGNMLLSDQSNTGAISSVNNANVVTISSSAADGAGAAAEGSTLSISGNMTEARATANLVLNSSISVGGASTSDVDASGLIGNFQFNDGTGTVNAEASTQTTISLNGVTGAAALSNGSAVLQGNSTLALARGNVVENVLNAEGANIGAGASPASVASGQADEGVLSASFGVFNEQVQQAAINATSSGARYAINATSGTGNALNAASATVDGNSINASAFGNVATNRVTLTSLNGAGNGASAAVFNGQVNSGAITSFTTGAVIGSFSTGGIDSATVGVMGNSISATSVGNFASSTVTRATR